MKDKIEYLKTKDPLMMLILIVALGGSDIGSAFITAGKDSVTQREFLEYQLKDSLEKKQLNEKIDKTNDKLDELKDSNRESFDELKDLIEDLRKGKRRG
jgi:hypothetical protein